MSNYIKTISLTPEALLSIAVANAAANAAYFYKVKSEGPQYGSFEPFAAESAEEYLGVFKKALFKCNRIAEKKFLSFVPADKGWELLEEFLNTQYFTECSSLKEAKFLLFSLREQQKNDDGKEKNK